MKKITLLLLMLATLVAYGQTQSTLPAGSTPYGNVYISPDGGVWTGATGKTFKKIGLAADLARLNDSVTAHRSALNLKVDKITGKGLSAEDFTTILKAKLDGIATGATANQTDAYLLSRVNHTGTQVISTIVGLQTALDGKLASSLKGAAGGVAELDGSGKVPLSQINDALIGSVNYQGTYNAAANTPALPSASGNKGKYYVVSTAGTVSSISYGIGDWIISDGSNWGKVDNNNTVASVFGRTGAITADFSDYSDYYSYRTGGNASGTWPINITGVSATATTWNGQSIDASTFITPTMMMGYNGTVWGPVSKAGGQTFYDINNGATLNNSISGSATQWAGNNYNGNYSSGGVYGFMINNTTTSLWERATVSQVQTALGVSGGPFLPLTGGALTGDLTTSARVGIGNTASNARLEVTQSTGEVFRADAASGAYRIVADQTGVNFGGLASFDNSLRINNGEFFQAKRHTSGSVINVLGFEIGTDDLIQTFSNTWKLRNTEATNMIVVDAAGNTNVTGTLSSGSVIFANATDANIRLRGGNNEATDGFVGASAGGLLYFRNWAGTRGFTIDASNVLTHTGSITAANFSSTNNANNVVQRDGSGNFAAGTITANLNGNAATVTNGVYTTGSYSNPSWITALAAAKVTGLATVATTGAYSDLSGLPSLNISNWNTAYSWGNHASAGYLTSSSLSSYVTSDTYTPTPTAITNVSSYGAFANYYTSINNQVTVYGILSVTPNTTGLWTIEFDLPTSATFSSGDQLIGVGTSTDASDSPTIYGYTGNGKCRISGNSGAVTIYYSLRYYSTL